jgi:Opacity family porin protein.
MKKVLAIALLCAVSSFATWDYFPAKDAGNGEVKVGFGYYINPEGQKNYSILGATADARYSIIDGLEIALFTQFPLSASVPDKTQEDASMSCKAEGEHVCPPTYGPPVIGVRYWLPMGLGIALDVALPKQGDAYPTGGHKKEAKYNTHLDFIPALQFSTNLAPELSFGSQVSLTIPGETKDEKGDKEKAGMDLGIGVEFDYSTGSVTPYLGVDIAMGLTPRKVNGEVPKDKATKTEEEAKKTGIDVGVGATFTINDNMSADVGLICGFGGRYEATTYDKKTGFPSTENITPLTIQAHFSYNF